MWICLLAILWALAHAHVVHHLLQHTLQVSDLGLEVFNPFFDRGLASWSCLELILAEAFVVFAIDDGAPAAQQLVGSGSVISKLQLLHNNHPELLYRSLGRSFVKIVFHLVVGFDYGGSTDLKVGSKGASLLKLWNTDSVETVLQLLDLFLVKHV